MGKQRERQLQRKENGDHGTGSFKTPQPRTMRHTTEKDACPFLSFQTQHHSVSHALGNLLGYGRLDASEGHVKDHRRVK